jgi:hypothetical protein
MKIFIGEFNVSAKKQREAEMASWTGWQGVIAD